MSVNENLSVVVTFVRSLMAGGMRDVCVSPGSRSTPLTAAMVREPGLQVWSLLDERSAAFFALGLAKAKGRPVGLVCTSGTAVANYFPAVIEASYSEVPLVVLTADRPAELREVGSNQTIDQVKVFGTHVKWAYEMPVPDGANMEQLDRHASHTARRAIEHAMNSPLGPVHINYPFREPLMPPVVEIGSVGAPVQVWRATQSVPDRAVLDEMLSLIRQAKRPLLVCGPQQDEKLPDALFALAKLWQMPILADPLSQLRTHLAADDGLLVDGYDLLLRHPAWKDTMVPDLVLRFGKTPTSKVLLESLQRWRDSAQVVVHEAIAWPDPGFTGTHFVQAPAAWLCRELHEQPVEGKVSNWSTRWSEAAAVVRGVAADTLQEDGQLALEGRIFLELPRLLPNGSALFVGNSMPIRHADTFLPSGAKPIRMFGNRGASGIDGIVSSAFGVSAGLDGPTVLVLGDVSFYHDLNGLLAATRLGLSLLVIVVHNDGGGIFTFLPQAGHEDVVTAFTTPHGLTFDKVVQMYGGDWYTPVAWAEFRDAVATALNKPGLQVVQLTMDKDESRLAHQRYVGRVMDAISEFVSAGNAQ